MQKCVLDWTGWGMDPMARLCGHVPLNSVKNGEIVDVVGDGHSLHFFHFLLRTKCKVSRSTSLDMLMTIYWHKLCIQVCQTRTILCVSWEFMCTDWSHDWSIDPYSPISRWLRHFFLALGRSHFRIPVRRLGILTDGLQRFRKFFRVNAGTICK